jgi:hypothetical protein
VLPMQRALSTWQLGEEVSVAARTLGKATARSRVMVGIRIVAREFVVL